MKVPRLTGLGLSSTLALLLLLLSFTRIAGDAQAKGFRGAVLATVFTGDIWGSTLVRNVALFGAALLVLHLCFALFVWAVARASAIAWPSQDVPLKHHVLIWFIVMTVALLANNAAAFPRSSLGSPYARAMMTELGGISLGAWIGMATLAAAALTVAMAVRKRLPALVTAVRARSSVAIACGAAAAVVGGTMALPAAFSRAEPDSRPNVVLIGLDSLRYDIIAADTSPGVTPNLDAFLTEATSFSNAITPLARTFPSVTSILTGRNPHRTGAVINLLPRKEVNEGETLGKILGRAGYTTAYATDEVRFSNIDATYGFKTTVTPPIGASEFLLSLFADTPLSNLFVNTAIGKLLFPHVHANRGAALTYDPDKFLDRIAREVPFRSPLFLHVHLTLPHWPYTWADAPVPRTALGHATDTSRERWPVYYLDSVQRADRQFADLLGLLERRGVLENALVIVYSDHGEAFGYDSESIVPVSTPALTELNAKPGFGHGTSVLSPHQYRVVLAMRGYGPARSSTREQRRIDAPVSVIDIAPTVLELLGVSQASEPKTHFDGVSLAALLRGEADAASALAGRIRFTETEYDPGNVATPDGAFSASAIREASVLYRVDSRTDRIEVRLPMLAKLLRTRQYAAIGTEHLLAAVPTEQGAAFEYLLIDQKTGASVRLQGAPSSAAPLEAHTLWRALHQEYGRLLNAAVLSPPAGGL